ncbi:MAG: MFS transporter [Candidatus Lokiarchaeia archaeon]|nr:MFS transporter [Candidatus Lokiarchaeia archaeon]
MFFLSTAAIIVPTYVPRYIINLGVNKPLMQLIITIFPLTAFIFPPLYGYLSDKTQNRRIFILIGTIGLSIVLLILFLFQNLILLVILLFFFGFFMASSSLLLTLFAELVENDKKLISYYNAIIVAGWFVGAQSGGIFIDLYNIENIFLFILILSLPAIISVAFIKEKRSLILERYNNKKDQDINSLIFNNTNIENPISQSIYYSLFFRNFSIKPIMPILVLIMSPHLNNDTTAVGFLIGINFLLQFFQTLLIGHIISIKNIKQFMIIGYALSAISIFGYIISNNFWSYLFFQLLVSFSYSTHWTATTIYIAQNTNPKNKGRYVGYANTSVASGSFFGGLFFSLLLTINQDFYISMYFLLIFPIISTIIILLKFKVPEKIR